MTHGTILSGDVKKALEILEFAYDLRTDTATLDGQEIEVVYGDLIRGEMRLEDFIPALYILKEDIPGMSILYCYDVVNGEPPTGLQEDPEFKTVAKLMVPSEFKNQLEKDRSRQENNALTKSLASEDPFFVFNLTKEGKLSRNMNGEVEEYAMEQDSLRHRIIKELRKGSFRDTKTMAEILHTEERSIRSAIGDIKRQIQERFDGVKGKDFIFGKRMSGYCLGSRIRITYKQNS